MKCKFIRSDGVCCGANAMKDSDFCFSHNPFASKEKKLAVIKGGMNRKLRMKYGERLEIRTPKDIKKLLGEVINGVWTGKIPCREPANTIGFLARCFLDAYEKYDIETRLEKIEFRLDAGGVKE